MAGKITEKSEISRLNKVYKELPKDKLALVEGLICEAARLRVQLDRLWKDLTEHGTTEMFQQNKEVPAYERERPASKLYTTTSKNYQAIIKQLDSMLPSSGNVDELEEFLNG